LLRRISSSCAATSPATRAVPTGAGGAARSLLLRGCSLPCGVRRLRVRASHQFTGA
jgi:hypothetical protein